MSEDVFKNRIELNPKVMFGKPVKYSKMPIAEEDKLNWDRGIYEAYSVFKKENHNLLR